MHFLGQSHQVTARMRELFTSLFLVLCLIPVALGGLQVASDLSQQGARRSVSKLDTTPLWSSQVERVDPTTQAYERLPSALANTTMVASVEPARRVSLSISGSSPIEKPQEHLGGVTDQLQIASLQKWCSARFRSYNPDDNTYQPFDGGPRQVCAAPFEAAASVERNRSVIAGGGDAIAKWCTERYRSYRAEDNTYLPFSGGRRQCPGPGSQSANNIARSVPGVSIAQF